MSVATVSRVLSNDGEGVRPLTQASGGGGGARLQYHGVAAALRRPGPCRSRWWFPIANPYFAGLVEALGAPWRHSASTCCSPTQENPATEKARESSRHSTGGPTLVIVPTHEQESAPALAPAAGIPVIQLDRRVEDFEADWVGTTTGSGWPPWWRTCVRGHHRVVSSAKPTNHRSGAAPRFRDAHPMPRRCCADFSMEWGERAFRKLRAQDPAVSAVVCQRSARLRRPWALPRRRAPGRRTTSS